MKSLTTPSFVLATAVAAAVSLSAVATDVEAKGKKNEKCYGVAKAGKNDCAAGPGTSCQGTSKTDGQKNAWIYVPKGLCEKLVGGSLEAK